MSVLVDTNILLRSVEPLHPHHAIAVAAVSQLLAENTPVYFTLQNIAEFWNVATRPIANNGLGLSIPFTLGEVDKIEGLLTLPPDTPAVYAEWKRILVDHGVSGVKVHDARLVAPDQVIHRVGDRGQAGGLCTSEVCRFAVLRCDDQSRNWI